MPFSWVVVNLVFIVAFFNIGGSGLHLHCNYMAVSFSYVVNRFNLSVDADISIWSFTPNPS